MKNHWLERKKQRAESAPVINIPDINIPQMVFPGAIPSIIGGPMPPIPSCISINWGTPPVISCVVTVNGPTDTAGICDTVFSHAQEINESQTYKGNSTEVSGPGSFSLQSIGIDPGAGSFAGTYTISGESLKLSGGGERFCGQVTVHGGLDGISLESLEKKGRN